VGEFLDGTDAPHPHIFSEQERDPALVREEGPESLDHHELSLYYTCNTAVRESSERVL
jgi:hypothetical protein